MTRTRRERCYLYANIAFGADIDRDDANGLLRQANDLSYRQLQMLALVARTQRSDPQAVTQPSHSIMWEALRRAKGTPFTAHTVLDGLEDLERRRYISVVHGVSMSIPSSVRLTGVGEQLLDLFELWRIDGAELDQMDTLLHWELPDNRHVTTDTTSRPGSERTGVKVR